MFLRLLTIVISLFCLTGSSLTIDEVQTKLENIYGTPQESDTRSLGKGLDYTQLRYDDFQGKPQVISLLVWRQNDTDLQITPAGRTGKPLATVATYLAEKKGIAAINGGFFRINGDGAHVGLLKIDGKELQGADLKPETGVICMRDGKVEAILRRKEVTPAEWQNLLGSIQMLVEKGKVLPQSDKSRNPRTVAALTSDKTLLLAVFDGRHQESSGVTLTQAAEFLCCLDAQAGLNLDGGGSSTMVFADETGIQVANYPSDNQKFDHNGSRAVTSALVLLSKNPTSNQSILP